AMQARVRLSHFGGTTYYNKLSPLCNSVDLSSLIEDVLFALITSDITFSALNPSCWGYDEYVWGRNGHDEIGDIEFDLPLPPRPSPGANPAYFFGPIEGHQSGNPPSGCEQMAVTYVSKTNSFRVRIPGCNVTLPPI